MFYDEGVQLTSNGFYGQHNYIKHATRGTLSLQSLYLLLWANAGAFCVGLLTDPEAENKLLGSVFPEHFTVRHFCMSQLRTLWKHLSVSLGISVEERSFLVSRCMWNLMKVQYYCFHSSNYLSIYLSTSIYIYPSDDIYLHVHVPNYVSIYLSIYIYPSDDMHLHVHVPNYVSSITHPSIHPIYLFIHLVHPSIYRSIYLHVSIHLFIYPCLSSIHLFIHITIHPSILHSSINLFIRLSIHITIHHPLIRAVYRLLVDLVQICWLVNSVTSHHSIIMNHNGISMSL